MSTPHTSASTARQGGHATATVAPGPSGPVLTVHDADETTVATRELDPPRGRLAVEPRQQRQLYEAVLAELGYSRSGAWHTKTGWEVCCPVAAEQA